MRPVKGYLSDDGTYFDNAEDAELYDAMHGVKYAVETKCRANPRNVFIVLDTCADEIRRYLDAKANQAKADSSYDPQEPFEINWAAGYLAECSNGPVSSDIYHPDNFGPNDLTSVLKFSPNVNEPMPDLGGSVGTEAIPDTGTVDGVGSGRSDASSVRSDPYLATAYTDEAIKARDHGSE